ncbi:MAG: hypothetical protein AAF429_12405 [Pseudomonadota bacterium]
MPIIFEANPKGLFCLDGSHRVKAIHDEGDKYIEILVVSDAYQHPPPSKLISLEEVVVSERIEEWRERFIDFRQHLFRRVAGELDALSVEISEKMLNEH